MLESSTIEISVKEVSKPRLKPVTKNHLFARGYRLDKSELGIIILAEALTPDSLANTIRKIYLLKFPFHY